MARTQTIVQLNAALVKRLDACALRRGISRSALIREAVEHLLDDDPEELVTTTIVEGYRRSPQAAPDEWGEVFAVVDTSTSELLGRLEAEERAAGVDSW